MSFHLAPLHEDHFERLHNLFDSVCREKRFLAFTQAGPKDVTFAYYRRVLEARDTHFVALRGEEIIGWCDVLAQSADVRKHVGVLGMAVADSARGRGVGRTLITAAIAHATERGLTRLELTVHAQNVVAQSLYKSVGFQHEGTQVRSWLIDGVYFDVHCMARLCIA
jgi:putative acetyltransferase